MIVLTLREGSITTVCKDPMAADKCFANETLTVTGKGSVERGG